MLKIFTSGPTWHGRRGWVMKIGVRLRELRHRRDLSTRAVAVRSGVSHSSISLIERDKISPSLDTLQAILDALGTSLPQFFSSMETAAAPTPFYRAADMVEIGRPKAVSYRMVGSIFPNRSMLMLHETYAPGAATGKAVSHPAQEGGVIISGAVEITVAGKIAVLGPGDGYYFDSRDPHSFRNVSSGVSEIVSAINPPTY